MELYLTSTGGYFALMIMVGIVLAGASLIVAFNHYVAKHIFIVLIEKILGTKRTGLGKIIIDNKIPHLLAYLIPAVVLCYFSYLFDIDHPHFKLFLAQLVLSLSEIYIIFNVALIFSAILNCIDDRYNQYPIARLKPIKSYLQLIKIIIFGICIIFAASIFFDKPPIYFFTGVGATTAFLALIFKDVVMGFMASIQLAAYDMVRIGDWIEMPNFGADGEVMEISLSTVKVQNFDKTIVTIPSYSLLTSGLKNWRGMHDAGGRRVKRSISVDINSIKMCDADLFAQFHDLFSGKDLQQKDLTNIGWFRQYLQQYLQKHDGVHKGLKILVRQLQGTANGLPLELYFFTNETDSSKYEGIQADIIEHVYAIMPRFQLRAFQSASGHDE